MVKRKVIQYTKDMVPVRTWDSIKEAQETYHISHISVVCRRQRKSDGGYIWRYEDPAPLSHEEKRRRAREIAMKQRGAGNGDGRHTERAETMSDLAGRVRQEGW